MKLPEEFKKQWIAALRSGEYKQGQRALIVKQNDEVSYCCLGLAYKIAKGVDPIETKSGYIDGDIDVDGVPMCLVGNASAYSNAGYGIRKELAYMNDDGKSFSEIADWIEENL